MGRDRAFALIELLVVVAIIALLMSISLPVMQRVKRQAKVVVCQSNLRQWGLIFSMYGHDNDNKMTTTGRDGYWLVASRPYLGVTAESGETSRHELYFCPTATRTAQEGGRNPHEAWFYDYDGVNYVGSYGFNAWVYDFGNTEWYQDRPAKDMWRTFNPHISQGNQNQRRRVILAESWFSRLVLTHSAHNSPLPPYSNRDFRAV
ncbi:MAG TPA: type II secretion system protein, partial [Sedimentisphaerales bacterium]|nr:type II secretion system protein [Sedimentisphaerales bacterium]